MQSTVPAEATRIAAPTEANPRTRTPGPGIPVLEAREGSRTHRLGARFDKLHPALVFIVMVLVGYLTLLASSIVLGLIVVRLLATQDSVGSADERIVAWLVGGRTPGLVDASWVGSTLSGGLVIPTVIAAVLAVCTIARRWRIAAFVLFAVALESATYRATTLAVPRDRPTVDRLEALPADASFPSGHTAASIALFCGLALLVTSWLRNAPARVAVWIVALAIPPFVAWSRMIRGMHHPLDVAGGVAIGVGAIVVVVVAARVSGAVAAAREATTSARPEPR
jgi:membrane-associated phospholipid phosphatase